MYGWLHYIDSSSIISVISVNIFHSISKYIITLFIIIIIINYLLVIFIGIILAD